MASLHSCPERARIALAIRVGPHSQTSHPCNQEFSHDQPAREYPWTSGRLQILKARASSEMTGTGSAAVVSPTDSSDPGGREKVHPPTTSRLGYADGRDRGSMKIRLLQSFLLFVAVLLWFYSYLFSLERIPLPSSVFWTTLLLATGIVAWQSSYIENSHTKAALVLAEIVTLSFTAQMIFVIPVGAGVFGRDMFFDLSASEAVARVGWPIPPWVQIPAVTRTVSDWPLIHFLGDIASATLNVQLFSTSDPQNILRWFPSIISLGTPALIYTIANRIYGVEKPALLAALASTLILTNVMFHSSFVRETLAYVLLFGFVLAFIISEFSLVTLFAARILSVVLLVSLAFSHHLTFLFALLFIVVFVLIPKKGEQNRRDPKSAPNSDSGRRARLLVLLTLGSVLFVAYLAYVGEPVFGTLVTSLADLAQPQVVYSPVTVGITRARLLLAARIGFGAAFAGAIVKTLLRKDAKARWDILGFAWGTITSVVGLVDLFVVKTATITLFRLEGFAWPFVIIAGTYSLLKTSIRRFVPFIVLLFVLANVLTVPPYVYLTGTMPAYAEGVTTYRYSTSEYAATYWLDGSGKILGDGTAQQLLIGLRQLEVVNDPGIFSGHFANLSSYQWIFLRSEDSYLVAPSAATERPVAVTSSTLANLNADPSLSRVYDNGEVEVYRSE